MRIIFIVMLLLFVGRTEAQIFPVDTLFKNGDIANRINLVFLSDGYQANEMGKYITDVNALLNNMFNQVPFKHYKNYFNAFAIKVPSNQSGAKHPRTSPDNDCAPVPQLAVDNYFGSTFDYANIISGQLLIMPIFIACWLQQKWVRWLVYCIPIFHCTIRGLLW